MESVDTSYRADEAEILKLAVENTTEAFVTIDENHRILFFNKAAERLFGYERKEVLGRSLDIILGDKCRKGHRAAVDRYLNGEKKELTHQEQEFVITRKGGKTLPVVFSFSVALLNGKHYFTAIIKDISDLRACHERVVRSERLAALGQLVAEIVHEIRNPLMLIGGFTRQLKRVVKDRKSEAKLEIILQEVERLESLLTELKELYIPKEIEFSVFDINGLLKELYLLVADDCKNKNIEIHLNADADQALVEGDREKIKQVFLNLIKNAVEAQEKGGILRIESRKGEKYVDVLITDNGPGIPEEYREKVFSPFFTTKKYGTGLGLSISKRIIDQHPGCSISLISEQGGGATFKVSIPLARDVKK